MKNLIERLELFSNLDCISEARKAVKKKGSGKIARKSQEKVITEKDFLFVAKGMASLANKYKKKIEKDGDFKGGAKIKIKTEQIKISLIIESDGQITDAELSKWAKIVSSDLKKICDPYLSMLWDEDYRKAKSQLEVISGYRIIGTFSVPHVSYNMKKLSDSFFKDSNKYTGQLNVKPTESYHDIGPQIKLALYTLADRYARKGARNEPIVNDYSVDRSGFSIEFHRVWTNKETIDQQVKKYKKDLEQLLAKSVPKGVVKDVIVWCGNDSYSIFAEVKTR